VSACRSHAELIGPYVLQALEPDEMEAMRLHLEGCPRCSAEAHALAALPALLDQADADDAVAVLPPELEEQVLDRFVRERATPPRAPRRSWRRVAVPALAVAAVAAAVLVATLPGGTDSAYARAELWSLPAGHGAAGSAKVDEVAGGTRVHLSAHNLPGQAGTAYELWCVRTDGRWINGGSFRARADGTAAAELTAAVTPGEYHVVVITRRSTGGQRGAEVMRGKLDY
jgi:hypothetical protein